MRGGSGKAVVTTLGTTIGAWIISVAWAGAQAPARPPMAEDVFKNIQVLRGIPVDEFMGTMGFLSASLGLNCTDCHTGESGGDWVKYADDSDLKRTARRMMLMVQNINRTNFGGRQVVTCFTCHRGSDRPTVMPSLNGLYGEPPPDEPGDPFRQSPGQPPADQILDKYLAAVGGAPRAAALRSFTAKGTFMGFDDSEKSPIEIVANAEGQRTTILHLAAGDMTTTVDGANGWMAGPRELRPIPVTSITGQELEGLKVEGLLSFPAGIKRSLTNWRAGLPAILDDREVQVVQGDTPGGAVVTLVFDAETGLLTRMVRYAQSPIGRLVTRVDYSDYRDVAGVKLPFKWTVAWLSGRSRYELTEVQANTRIDSARFARPTAPVEK